MEQREKRVSADLVVQLFEGAARRFQGVTRDIGATGFSAFLKPVAEGIRKPVNYAVLTVPEITKRFAERPLSVVLEMGLSLGPVGVSLIRAEHSWQKNFEIFAAFRFDRLNETDKAALSKYLEEHEEAVSLEKEPGEEETGGEEEFGESDVIHISFPGRHFYLAHMRDLCEKLVLQRGFAKEDALKIKVAFDEVLTNAFKHGCTDYGRDKIDIQISFDTTGIFVHVKDPGGKPFDYKKYREFDKRFPDSSRTGLHLVDKFTDGWAVNTKRGKYTEVSFFKNRPQEEKK